MVPQRVHGRKVSVLTVASLIIPRWGTTHTHHHSPMQQEPRKAGLFPKIESREDALKVTKDSAGGFFVAAAIQGGIGVFIMPSFLIDAAILAMLAAILRTWSSRVAAVLLLLMSAAIAVITLLSKFGFMEKGGSNIFLALLMLFAAIRAVQSTFLLHGKYAESKDPVL